MLLVELFRIHQRHWDEILAAVRFLPSSNSAQTSRSSSKPRRHFRDWQRLCWKCCEARRRPIVPQQSPVPRRSLPPSQDCSPAISSGGLGHETRLLPFGPIIPPVDLILALRIQNVSWPLAAFCWRSSQLGSCFFRVTAKTLLHASVV